MPLNCHASYLDFPHGVTYLDHHDRERLTMTQFLKLAQNHARDESSGSFKPAMLTTVAMLGATWLCTWWFDISHPIAMAVSLVILVVGLMAHGIGVALASHNREKTRTTDAPTARAGSTMKRILDRDVAEVNTPRFSAQLNGKRWTLDVFKSIDAQRFAAVCETWFAWAGFDTRSETHRTDEGVDIWLHAAKMPGPVAIVRCKHWLDRPVGLQEMKDFLGVMASCKSVHGTYTTTSTYTAEALQFAKEHGIDAVDGRGLLRRIQTRTHQRQQALLAVAFQTSPGVPHL